MTNKKKHLPIPFFSNPRKGLIARGKALEIGLSLEEQAQDQYTQDHIIQLEEEIKSLSHAKEQITHLKTFRDMLSGHCLKDHRRITILQCSSYWKNNQCNYKECDTRKPWLNLF
jgi:hypothetical protein